MKVAVYGVGGVGGYFGAHLARAGVDVRMIARGEHLRAIQDRGLCVTSPNGEMLVQPAMATDEPAQVGVVDVVILGVKAGQVRDVADSLRPLIGPDTFVLPLQNGVEAAAELVAALGAQHVVAGLCGTMSWVSGPGHIRSLGDVNFVRFGEFDDSPSDRLESLRMVFEAAGVKAEVPADIQAALWEKFLFVASIGGVGAVNRTSFGVLRDDPESRRMLELAMREIFDLAILAGVGLDDSIVARTMSFVDQLPAEGTTSLQRDIVAGKPSELDAWSGAVVRLAAGAGLDVPVHTFIYENLLPMELEARGTISDKAI
jgi:2-dehydropantoate 2-reductase